MSKILKKIPWAIAIVLLIIVLILNIVYTMGITRDERIIVNKNNLIDISCSVLIAVAIIVVSQIIKKKSYIIKDKNFVFGIFVVIYIICQLLWIDNRYIALSADQKYTYELAAAMKDGNIQEYVANTNDVYGNISMTSYLECYPQQITLSFVWNILFHIFNSTAIVIIMQFNVFCNALTVVSTYLICNEISKKYKTNKYQGTILIFTFLPIFLLCVFAYGDIPGLAFSMLGLYFIIRHVNDKKIRYAIFSILSLTLACMVRTNSLIFVIAILIYLFLDMITKGDTKKTAKDILTRIAVVIGLIAMLIIPSTIIKNYYLSKLNLDKNGSFPASGWICMGIQEGECTSRMVQL